MSLDSENNNISRREFLLNAAILPFAVRGALKDLINRETEPENLDLSDELTTLGSIETSIDASKNIPEFLYTYSTFTRMYLENLGFILPEKNLEPDTNTQVKYIRELSNKIGNNLTANIPLEKLDDDVWEEIPAGTVLFFPSSQKNNSYIYSAIYLGLDSNQKPLISGYVNKQRYSVSIQEILSIYRNHPIKDLNVFAFDSVEACRRYGLDSGVIRPEHQLFKSLGYDTVVTVNVNDGTLSMWDIQETEVKQMNIGNTTEKFCAVGKVLKKNPFLSEEYWNSPFRNSSLSSYDGISGMHIDHGVRRRNLTPLLITDYSGTAIVDGFGGLGPDSNTDICVLKPLVWNELKGQIELGGYSSYTLHELPKTNDPHILGRLPSLLKAREEGRPLENPNLSAGCVNMDSESWLELRTELNNLVKKDKKISVVFTSPLVKQKNLILPGQEGCSFHSSDPFGGKSSYWEYQKAKDYGPDLSREKVYSFFSE